MLRNSFNSLTRGGSFQDITRSVPYRLETSVHGNRKKRGSNQDLREKMGFEMDYCGRRSYADLRKKRASNQDLRENLGFEMDYCGRRSYNDLSRRGSFTNLGELKGSLSFLDLREHRFQDGSFQDLTDCWKIQMFLESTEVLL